MREKPSFLAPANRDALRNAVDASTPEVAPEPVSVVAAEPEPKIKKPNPRQKRGKGGSSKVKSPESEKEEPVDPHFLLVQPDAPLQLEYKPVVEEDKPSTKKELLDSLKRKVFAIGAEINAITPDNGEAARLRDVEYKREALGRRGATAHRLAEDAGVNLERDRAQYDEDQYLEAYKAFHLKQQTEGLLSAGAEKKVMVDLEEKAREAQIRYINKLRESTQERVVERTREMHDKFLASFVDSKDMRARYDELKANGKLERDYTAPNEDDNFKAWAGDRANQRISQMEKRSMRLAVYSEVTKPFILRKQRARAESLEATRMDLFEKGLTWVARKASEANKNLEGGIQKKLEGRKFKIGKAELTISKAMAQRLAKGGARGARLLVTTIAAAGGGALFGVAGALGLAGYRLASGATGIVTGTGIGWGFGSLFEKTFGKSWSKKRDLTAHIAGNSRGLTPKDLREAEKFETRGSKEAIEAWRNRVEMTTAALVAGGVSLEAAEIAGNLQAAHHATEQIRDAHIDLKASQEQIERLAQQQSKLETASVPTADTDTSGTVLTRGDAPAAPITTAPTETAAPVTTAPTETIGKIPQVSETAQAGDGSDRMFRRLKADLAKQYEGNVNVPPKIKEIIDTDEHVLSRKYGLAWDSSKPGALDESANLEVGDKFGINADGKPTITRDGVTFELQEGKSLPKGFGGEAEAPKVVPEEQSIKAPTARIETDSVEEPPSPPSAPVEAEVPVQETAPVEAPKTTESDYVPLSDRGQNIVEAPSGPVSAPQLYEPNGSDSDYVPLSERGAAPKLDVESDAAVSGSVLPNPNSIKFAPFASSQEFDPYGGIMLEGGIGDPMYTSVYNFKGTTWVLGGSFADQRAEALKFAMENPNTVVRFEGQPYMVDGKLQRWTASAISDGSKIVSPPYPTNEMDLKKPPDINQYMSFIKKSVRQTEA